MTGPNPSEAYSRFRRAKHFGSLDGIRALSIIAVIWHHAQPIPLMNMVGLRGFLGVDMFFTLSGFLIVTLLLRERERHGRISLKDFYARRTLRIFPLYYAVVGLGALVAVARPSGAMAESYWRDLPYLLTYTTNWHHAGGFLSITWSLAAEEQFYLLWPSLEKAGRRVARCALVALIVASQLIQLHAVDGLLESWFGWSPAEPKMLRQTTFTPILFGVGLAHLLHEPRTYDRIHRLVGGRFATPVLAAALIGFLLVVPPDISGIYRLVIHLLMVAFLAACLVNEAHALAPLFASAPMVRIGVLSYGMYLLHMVMEIPCGRVARGLGAWATQGPAFFAILLAATYVASELSYRLFETRFLRLKSRFGR